MERECIKEAPTVAEAVDAALEELGVQQDAVGYEVLEEPGRKMFGIGGDRGPRSGSGSRTSTSPSWSEARRATRSRGRGRSRCRRR